jgi:PAS domain S-box-containing protein
MSSRDVSTVSFEQFFWSSSDLMSVVDLDANFVLVNSAYRHILGWEPEDLIGQSCRDYFHPDDLERATSAFAPVNDVVPSVVELDVRQRCHDGAA